METEFIVGRSIMIDAPRDVIFGTLTDPELIVQAYPLTAAQIEPRVGGVLTLHGQTPEGSFTDHGTIEVFARPSRFKYRYWSTNHGTERTADNHMIIDYRLQAIGSGTRVEVLHENLLSAERRQMMGPAWDFLLAELKRYVESMSADE